VAKKKSAVPSAENGQSPGTEEVENEVVDTASSEGDDLLKRLERFEVRDKRIKAASKNLHKWQNKVAQSQQAHKHATAQLKADVGARDRAVLELQRVLDDVKNGQVQLPGTEETDDQATAGGTEPLPAAGQQFDMDVLSAAKITALVGKDAMKAAKDADDPLGMSDSQLEKLTATGMKTLNELEEFIRKDELWHRKIKGFGETAITRLTSTITAFRKVNPNAEPPVNEKTPTVTESLKQQNLAATAGDQADKPAEETKEEPATTSAA